MSEANDRRLAKFYVTVARELAQKEQALTASTAYDDILTRKRCLEAIASTSKHPMVKLYQPTQANKMALYVHTKRPIIEGKLSQAQAELQPKLI